MKYYMCPVCGKRWGDEIENAELEIARCERHNGQKSSRQCVGEGFSIGYRLRRKGLVGRPRKIPKKDSCL